VTPGEVELLLLPLAVAPDELARLRGHLSPDELQRGNRLIDKERRDRFFVGRGLLREALAGYLEVKPAAVTIAEQEFGKPHLPEQEGCDGIRFNVSHAGGAILIAVSKGREVGCDLEELRQDLEFRPMAERYFSQREREELFGLPAAEQLAAFYRCWTRKEAYLKAAGSGFSQPSTGFDVTLLPGAGPALLAHRGDPEEIERWEIRDVEVPQPYCAALAVARVQET
jgi:4'-phosphopantetheinyl transferase